MQSTNSLSSPFSSVRAAGAVCSEATDVLDVVVVGFADVEVMVVTIVVNSVSCSPPEDEHAANRNSAETAATHLTRIAMTGTCLSPALRHSERE